MSHEDDLDRRLEVDYAPPINELEAHARSNLLRWFAYLDHAPSLQELHSQASQIIDDIRAAVILEGTEKLAIKLALALDSQFEMLGIWQAWYSHLMELYEPVTSNDDELLQSQLFKCLMRYYLSQGNINQANAVINELLDIAEREPLSPLQDALIGTVSISATLTNDEKGRVLAEQLFSLAMRTGDLKLLGNTCAVLAQFYSNLNDVEHIFEFGQMVYCVGLQISEQFNDKRFLIHGLHYMGQAFQSARQPLRAVPYLRQAIQYAKRLGNRAQIDYLHYDWGVACYLAGDLEQAEQNFHQCLETFDGRGIYYAKASYMLGLSLMNRQRFPEAGPVIEKARTIWAQLKQPLDVMMADHALAHLSYLKGDYTEAITQIEQVIVTTEAITDNLRQAHLLKELRKDLDTYRQAQNAGIHTKTC